MTVNGLIVSGLALVASVAAHGHVNSLVINGVSYAGYNISKLPYMKDPPTVVGWTTTAKNNGFVAPDSYSGPDIICHANATNAGGHAQVAAGDKIYLQWDTWPESHHGPVMDYLAPCGAAGCETVDKTTLEFFKIDEVGLVDGSAAPGQYGSDLLIANSDGWLVEIPANIKPGFYVLRHEIIALHAASHENGAQNYPQCFNLEVTGSGDQTPPGVLGTDLYKAEDDGILFKIYHPLSSYPIPGPKVISGAASVEQSRSAFESSADPTTGTIQATQPAESSDPKTTSAFVPSGGPTGPGLPAVFTTPPDSTAINAAQPTAPATHVCVSKRKSKKARRHARHVNSRNEA